MRARPSRPASTSARPRHRLHDWRGRAGVLSAAARDHRTAVADAGHRPPASEQAAADIAVELRRTLNGPIFDTLAAVNHPDLRAGRLELGGPAVRRGPRSLSARRALLRLDARRPRGPPPTCCSTAAAAGSLAMPPGSRRCSTWPRATPGRSRSTWPPRASAPGRARCCCACSGPTPGAWSTSRCSAS